MRIGLHRIASKTHRIAQSVAALFLFLTAGSVGSPGPAGTGERRSQSQIARPFQRQLLGA